MARLQFSDTVNNAGILQMITRRTNTQNSTTSSYPTIDRTVDVNSALGQYMLLAMQAAGRWQVDDTNQVDYPIITTNLISGQQDYSFLYDATGNQILWIYKVRVLQPSGSWLTLTQRDLQDGTDDPLNSTQTGTPTQYDLTANGIILTAIPNYNMTNGLEVYISRTPTYFVSTDTTKVAGIPDMFHEYLALRPAYFYCLDKGLPQTQALHDILFGANGQGGIEQAIKDYHAYRNADERPRFSVSNSNADSTR